MTIDTDMSNRAEELDDIRYQIMDLLDQAATLLKGTGLTERRAQLYWMAHIRGALGSNNGDTCGSMVTMEESAADLLDMAKSKTA